MNKNPFIFDKPAKRSDFYNRKEETEVAIGYLRNLQSFSIVGERRIGKTSFLQYVLSEDTLGEEGVDPEKHIIISFNMSSFHEITKEGFIAAIVERTIEQTQIEIESGNAFDTLKACVEELALQGRNLIIALDEFEVIAPILEDNFSYWLRYILQNPNIMAITASQLTVMKIEGTERMASPLSNIFANLTLGLFPGTEAENMIKEMFLKGNLDLRREEISFLADLSGGYPYLIRLVGYYYYEERKKNREIIPGEFKKCMLHYSRDHFENCWEHLTREERRCLLQLESTDNLVCRILEEKGLLIRKNGKWEIFSELFREFLRNGNFDGSNFVRNKGSDSL